MKRILLIAPSWVGDAVMSQPLAARLEERWPRAQLAVFASPWVGPLYRRMREVDEVLENPFRHGALALGARYRKGRELAARAFDLAIVLPNSFKSALLPWFAHIPRRVGYVGEFRYGLLTEPRRIPAATRLVDRYAWLAEPPGAPLRPVPPPRLAVDEARRLATLTRLQLPPGPAIAFCPGAEYGPAKRWPAEHYAELAHRLHARGWQIWLVGSEKDQSIARSIREAARAPLVDLCGRTTLDEAVDVLASARAVVSNDSGLMHVAAAVGRPVVALFGSSSPAYTPPLAAQCRILRLDLPCSPCFERACPLGTTACLTGILPEQVEAALDALLAENLLP